MFRLARYILVNKLVFRRLVSRKPLRFHGEMFRDLAMHLLWTTNRKYVEKHDNTWAKKKVEGPLVREPLGHEARGEIAPPQTPRPSGSETPARTEQTEPSTPRVAVASVPVESPHTPAAESGLGVAAPAPIATTAPIAAPSQAALPPAIPGAGKVNGRRTKAGRAAAAAAAVPGGGQAQQPTLELSLEQQQVEKDSKDLIIIKGLKADYVTALSSTNVIEAGVSEKAENWTWAPPFMIRLNEAKSAWRSFVKDKIFWKWWELETERAFLARVKTLDMVKLRSFLATVDEGEKKLSTLRCEAERLINMQKAGFGEP